MAGQFSLEFGPILWSKPAGTEASLSFRLKPSANKGLLADAMRLDTPGLEARGLFEFNSDSSIRRLDLSRLAFGGNEVAASIRPRGGDGLVVAISGPKIDAGPYLEAFLSSEGVGELPPMHLSFQVQQLQWSH